MKRSTNMLAIQNYGSTTTLGARQTAIINHIAEMNNLGSTVDIDTLRFLHGRACTTSLPALRARGLVTGSDHNIRLTQRGAWVGRLTQQSRVPAGLGIVAVRVPEKRK